jgi:hypothetical protein
MSTADRIRKMLHLPNAVIAQRPGVQSGLCTHRAAADVAGWHSYPSPNR